MKLCRICLALALAAIASAPLAAQQPAVTIDDDDITIRGCITQASARPSTAPPMVVWSRSDIMLAAATAIAAPKSVGTSGVAGRVFYWLDEDDDEDLSKHVGQMVEIKGELEDFEKGEIEIKRDGEFIEIELDLDGKEEKARVPSAWLGTGGATQGDVQVQIAARKIDVDDVRVLGPCDGR